jgi:hypothetical protein
MRVILPGGNGVSLGLLDFGGGMSKLRKKYPGAQLAMVTSLPMGYAWTIRKYPSDIDSLPPHIPLVEWTCLDESLEPLEYGASI